MAHSTRAPRVAFALLLALVAGCGSTTSTAGAQPGVTAPGTSGPSATATTGAQPGPSAAPTGLPTLKLQPVGRFEQPVWATTAPGDKEHLYVVQKTGKVLVVDRAGRPVGTLLDLTGQVSGGGEQGLLSIAFSPRYATDRLVYADYTDPAGDSRVVEYAVAGLSVRPESRRELLFVKQPYANHNGGLLLFDRTGMLLVGLGDGGSGGDPERRAQNLGDLLGKILRIDPRGRPYAIPPDNPFVGRAGARGEIWAYGLRNPWRFAFDSRDGALYLGDVGQDKIEELDIVPPGQQAGANYGWPRFEGRSTYNAKAALTEAGPLIVPAVTYTHADGGCSITGGEVYRGSALPGLQGTYLYADFCKGAVLGLVKGRAEPVDLGLSVDALTSFARDADGELLVLSLGGQVSRIVAG